MEDEQAPEMHLFMVCRELNRAALSSPPEGVHFRACRRDELDFWMRMPFDTEEEGAKYAGFMRSFFDRVYASRADLFFERCTFACDSHDRPLATAFIWPIRERVTTVHWFKVERGSEGKGLGRAILSQVMRPLDAADYPVLLHTHPTSNRAIKLYSDVGFQLLSDPTIGARDNHLEQSLPLLRRTMPERAFDGLTITRAPLELLERLREEIEPEF